MADMNFMNYRDDDNTLGSDYFNGGEDDYELDNVDTQETYLPVDKLDQYIQSDNSYTRQLVAGGLLDVLKHAKDAQERATVFSALKRLAHDEEPNVRAEIVVYIPQIAEYCTMEKELEGLAEGLLSSIVPSVVTGLQDSDNQVRKASQAALLVLLENHMVDRAHIEAEICPVLLDLLHPDSQKEEFRTEAVSLMVRISPLLSKEVVEKQFLPRFCDLSSDVLFHIRKVCATSFGEMCRVVGPELSERYLLPKFFALCEDGIWGVRKACTECFMDVSNSLSPDSRRNELAQLFVGLLCDQSRWVRMSAFQALGPFISTFANPNTTGLYFDQDGILQVQSLDTEKPKSEVEYLRGDPSQVEEAPAKGPSAEPPSETPPSDPNEQAEESDTAVLEDTMDLSTEPDLNAALETKDQQSIEETRWLQYNEQTELICTPGEKDQSKLEPEDFGSFQYWRDPVPTLDLESLLVEVQQQETSVVKTVDQELEALASHLESGLSIDSVSGPTDGNLETANEQVQAFMFGPNSLPMTSGTLAGSSVPTYASVLAGHTDRRRQLSMSSDGGGSDRSLSELMAKQQDIIPHLLLENYLSMIDPSRAQTVDTDIAQHCAYSLPAVAFTLGRANWKCLKGLYEQLVADMQWKVRRTLAFSIHELAFILGPEITKVDLVPIFNGFIKDLDEVRIGVLAHLADFTKLLDVETRKTFLPKLAEFMESDNNRVWRPRLGLACQLMMMCDFYTSEDVVEYIVPLTLQLLMDQVAEIRNATLPLISRVLGLLSESSQDRQRLMLINDLIEKLARSDKWNARQTFIHACHQVLRDSALTCDQFAKELLPSVLTLSTDVTPNVRLAVSQLVSQCLLAKEYFTGAENPHHDPLMETEAKLKADPDRDVSFFATAGAHDFTPSKSQIENV